MTPEYLCSPQVTERDKAIACKSAFYTLKRHVEWPELLGHLEYLRHAIVRWGSCDITDSRIHAFLSREDTRTLAPTFTPTYASAARLLPFPCIVPVDNSIISDPHPLGASLHAHYMILNHCFDDLTNIDEMEIDGFSKSLWKDTIRSNCKYLETLDLLAEDLAVISSRCAKILVHSTILYREAQKYAACEASEDAHACVEWSKRMCGVLDGICTLKLDPCTYVEKNDAAPYMTAVCGVHNAIAGLYTPLPITSCPIDSPLEKPCKFMMEQYDIVVTKLHSP